MVNENELGTGHGTKTVECVNRIGRHENLGKYFSRPVKHHAIAFQLAVHMFVIRDAITTPELRLMTVRNETVFVENKRCARLISSTLLIAC